MFKLSQVPGDEAGCFRSVKRYNHARVDESGTQEIRKDVFSS
jgi:hypothetical protein